MFVFSFHFQILQHQADQFNFRINLIACINVIIVDDDDIEINQSFTIEIVRTSPNLVQIGTDNTTTVFIIDDDHK